MYGRADTILEFGEFRFAPESRRLWRGEELMLLAPKASELLGLLLDGGGKFVSKEEILDRVWPDTFVEEGVLTQNIYTLRKTLGSEMIENRTRLGYRITVPVERISGTDPNGPETPSHSGSGAIPTSRGRLGVALAAIAVIVLAAGLGWYFLRPVVASFVGPREEHVKFTQLTDTGDAHSAAISPDGNFAVIARGTKLDSLRTSLMARIAQLRDGVPGLPWALLPSLTAIQPLIVGDNEAAVALSTALWERGLWGPAIRPPTVPKGTARLRISVSAAHTAGDIATLIDTLKELA